MPSELRAFELHTCRQVMFLKQLDGKSLLLDVIAALELTG